MSDPGGPAILRSQSAISRFQPERDSQVARNWDRFPEDFMSHLTLDEADSLRSQTVTLKTGARGQHRKYLPYAFTEQGVAMLSSVLRSPRAVQVNIGIMRAFVRLRRMLQTNADLARKLDALEAKYDAQFKVVFQAIRELAVPPEKPRRRIGYGTGHDLMAPIAGNHQGALGMGSGVQESRPGALASGRPERVGGVLDFSPPRGYIDDIYSPSDQPSGLRRGFVLWGQASRPVPTGGTVHAA